MRIEPDKTNKATGSRPVQQPTAQDELDDVFDMFSEGQMSTPAPRVVQQPSYQDASQPARQRSSSVGFDERALYQEPKPDGSDEGVGSRIWHIIKGALREPAVVISVIALLFILLFMRAFFVPSGSMTPTLLEGDRIMSIARYFPNGHTYERGDIICFTAPSGDVYVKRVIGVGGDHIQISGETVYVNGEPSPWQGTGGLMTTSDIQLADDEYWVMGDNRGNSQDSRYIGPVKASQTISKVYGIYFPFNRAKFL